MSSIATISQSRSQKAETMPRHTSVGTSTDPDEAIASPATDASSDFDEMELVIEFDSSKDEISSHNQDVSESEKAKQRQDSLANLQGSSKYHSRRAASSSSMRTRADPLSPSKSIAGAQAIVHRNPRNGPDAVIVLKEEKVCFRMVISHAHDYTRNPFRQALSMIFSNSSTHSKSLCI